MRKNNILKAFLLLAIMTLGLVMPLTAQTDGFFKSNNDDYENRDTPAGGSGINNQNFELPLGSGLFIMAAAGAGYALARRRRSLRKAGTMVVALAMVLGFTQCKKNAESIISTNQGHTFVSLTVTNDAKHDIGLSGGDLGKVSFEDGDFLWVLNGNQVSGKLIYDVTKHKFEGYIDDDPTGVWASMGSGIVLDSKDKLHFCYTSNTNPDIDMDTDSGEFEFIMNVQNKGDKLHLMSFGSTADNLEDISDLSNLTCTLENKCALVKFILPAATDEVVSLVNVKQCARLVIAKANAGVYVDDDMPRGIVALYKTPSRAASDERWAIMLEQAAGTKADVVIGNKLYKDAVTFPQINNNNIVMNVPITTTGTPVELSYQAFFNKALGYWFEMANSNLQYDNTPAAKTESRYSLMQYPWSTVESNVSIAANYSGVGTVSLFGWGCWGKLCTAPYLTSNNNDAYSWSSDFDNELELDGKTGWRSMSFYEAYSVFTLRENPDQERYYSATVCETPGVIVLSDLWCGSIPAGVESGLKQGYSQWTVADAAAWNALASQGAVFLPAAGIRENGSEGDVTCKNVGVDGFYWTSTFNDDAEMPMYVRFGTDWGKYELDMSGAPKNAGMSVRLTRVLYSNQ